MFCEKWALKQCIMYPAVGESLSRTGLPKALGGSVINEHQKAMLTGFLVYLNREYCAFMLVCVCVFVLMCMPVLS